MGDLHLEFGVFNLPAVEAGVVIQAGDIGLGRKEIRWAEIMTGAGKAMNDYANISIGRGKEERKLLPADTLALHLESRAWLEQPYLGPTVVVTHHAPHPLSLFPGLADDPLSGAYVSDLSSLMGKAPLWIHGHIHASLDYTVAETRVVCNPRGLYSAC